MKKNVAKWQSKDFPVVEKLSDKDLVLIKGGGDPPPDPPDPEDIITPTPEK